MTCDTVKKQIAHDIRSKCKFGNDLAESSETETQHQKKEDLWMHLGFDEATIADGENPTQLELVDCTEFTKDRNKRFGMH